MKTSITYSLLFSFLFFGGLVTKISAQTANFTASPTTGCSNLAVFFTNQSTGNITSYNWQVYNAANVQVFQSTLPNPVFLFPAGLYDICLTVTGPGGSNQFCRQDYINSYALPQAHFTLSQSVGCSPFSPTFTDTSIPGTCAITNWNWNFGDGNIDNTQTPSHSYTSTGTQTFIPTLQITDACGCSSFVTGSAANNNTATATQSPTASFTINGPAVICSPPATFSFSNASTTPSGGTLSYAWNFGDGSPLNSSASPSHTYTTLGSFPVTLTVTDQLTNCTAVQTISNSVVIGSPSASFSASSVNICQGETINFTDLSVGASISNWNWNFGGGAPASTLQNPSITFANAGNFNVTMTALIDGCNGSFSLPIVVNSKPTAFPSASATQSCTIPFSVNFFANTANTTTWEWNFGDGSPAVTTQNASHTYTTYGTFTVVLLATNASGCQEVKTLTINIQPITANFSTSVAMGCVPLSVDLTNNSTSPFPITSTQWSFIGPPTVSPTSSTISNPSLIVQDTGCIDIRLIVINSAGCRDTLVMQDAVCGGMQLTPTFTATPDSSCAIDPITFTNTTLGNVTGVIWQFGDGETSSTISPEHEYQDIGPFTPCLAVFNYGCPADSCYEDMVVILGPIAVFTPTQTCTNKYVVDFADESVGYPTDWLWDFGTTPPSTSTLQNPTFDYTSFGTGTYTITLVTSNDTTGCESTTTQEITIADPVAQFSVAPTTGCVPFSPVLTNTSIDAASYTWTATGGTFSSATDVSPTLTYNNTGIYTPITLSITDVNGCTASASYTGNISVSGVTPSFTIGNTTGCVPLTTSFTSTSTTFLGNITSLNWDFGNGAFGTGVNPSATYTIPNGTFDVTLSVTNSLGCQSVLTQAGAIQSTYPLPSFTYQDTVCAGQSLNIVNTSQGVNLTYQWDFGTGNAADVSTSLNPTFTYSVDGTYQICVTATDANGCVDQVCHTVHVLSPVADFVGSPIFANCPPLLSNFVDQSQNAVSWLWSFGDNTGVSTLQSPPHVYTLPGVYTVSLTIISPSGCSVTHTEVDYVQLEGPIGNFTFTPDEGCVPLTVTFDINYAETDTLILIAGDGGFVKQAVSPQNGSATLQYTYPYGGTFYPAVQFKDNTNCTTSIISPTPVIVDSLNLDFVASDTFLCVNDCIQFFPSISTGSAVQSLDWSFSGGNPTVSTSVSPTVCYSTSGSYDVTLNVSNAHCTISKTKTAYIKVGDYPTAAFSFTPDGACTPSLVSFSDNSTSANPLTYSWDLDGNNIADSTSASPTFNYTVGGTYNASVTVTTVPFGCTATDTHPVNVLPQPIADAGNNVNICLNTSTTLQATGGVAYAWSPSTGLDNPNIANPIASPAVTTVYIVTVTGVNGCTATDSVTVTVFELPIANAGLDDDICNGQSIGLNAVATAGLSPYTFNWSTGSTNASITVTPTFPSETYNLTVTDANGCTATDDVIMTVNPLPIPTITAAPSTVCNGFSSVLTVSSTSGLSPYTYNWSTGSNLTVIQVTPPTVGINNYSVTVTDANGCTATALQAITVIALPNVAITSDTSIICINDTTTLTASPQGANYTYQWTPAADLTNPTGVTTLAGPVVTTIYTLVVTDQFGCTGTDTYELEVSPYALPVIVMSPDDTICYGGLTQLNVSGGFNLTTAYTWDNAMLGLTCYDGCSNPVATPLVTTTYVVTVEGPGGCKDQDSVTVYVRDERVPLLPPDTTICVGDTVNISLLTGTNPHWTGSTELDCSYCSSVNMFPANTTTYYVEATVNDCPVQDTITVNILKPEDISAGEDANLCLGESLILNGSSPGGLAVWTPDFFLSQDSTLNPVATPDTTTTYILSVTIGGCTLPDTVTINVVESADITTSDVTICVGDTAQLEASGVADSYEWTPATGLDDSTIPNPRAVVTQTTTYFVAGYIGNCPSDVDTVLVTVNNPTNLRDNYTYRFVPQQVLSLGVPDLVNPQDYTYSWAPSTNLSCTDCANPLVQPDGEITYTVTVTDANGCSDQMQIRILPLSDCEGDAVVVPNGFTPDGSGKNDVLYVRGSAITEITRFEVYNRWGERVFSTKSKSEGWDGKYNGKDAESGVYVYLVEFVCPIDNKTVIKSGNVTLIR